MFPAIITHSVKAILIKVMIMLGGQWVKDKSTVTSLTWRLKGLAIVPLTFESCYFGEVKKNICHQKMTEHWLLAEPHFNNKCCQILSSNKINPTIKSVQSALAHLQRPPEIFLSQRN